MFPDAELKRAREDVLATLPQRCDILTLSTVSDGTGGWTETWTTTRTGVQCRVDHRVGAAVVEGGAVQPETSYILTLPVGVTLTEFHRVRINGIVYYVRVVMTGASQIVNRFIVDKVV